MKVLLSAFLGVCVLASGLTGTALAALIVVDDQIFGSGSITQDTATGLDWLDLTVTTGQSFLECLQYRSYHSFIA